LLTIVRPKLGIIECGPVRAELAAQFGSAVDWFKAYLDPVLGARFEFTSYAAYRNDFPASVDDCAAWLLTGSVYGVYEQADWMLRLEGFVRNAALRKKVVGVCFGHQLIAKAFGGRVAKAEQGWQIGLQRYIIKSQKSWMTPPLQSFALVASHQDQIVTPPANAVVLAENAASPFGMMQLGDNILTIQLHPEMSVACSAALTNLRSEILGPERVAAAKASFAQVPDDQTFAKWIAQFLDTTQNFHA
jgi:GMP synthase-like glutamine amidotransferase